MTKEKFEKTLNVSIVGLAQAKRNRARYIKQLGKTYHEYAGKMALYNMMLTKKARGTKP